MPSTPTSLKTPPALKWLLNERAAVEGALQKARQTSVRLTGHITALQSALAKQEAAIRSCGNTLAALDLSIGLLHPEVGGSRPPSVNAWQGKYGARGGLRAFLLEKLREASPEPVGTDFLCNQMVAHFGVDDSAPSLRERAADAVKGGLRTLANQGLAERLPTPRPNDKGLWRLRQVSPLDQLRALAQAQASGHDPPLDAAGGQVDRQ